jgi:hypothetical protein
MLTRNIYILYPPGYSGTYLKWALTISDKDLFENTVKNPVNKDDSGKYGGTGTAHQHLRIPTHQLLTEHLHWVLYNKPAEKLIYVLNCESHTSLEAIESIIRYDAEPVFIVLHNGNDYDTAAYAAINCTIKWPLWLEWRRQRVNILWPELDINTIGNNIDFRNYIAENFSLFRQQSTVTMQQIKDHIEFSRFNAWYEFRNARNPQEVNADNYLIRTRPIEEDVYLLNCKDIVSDKLPGVLEDINEKFAYSNNFSSAYIKSFQPDYLETQTTIHWFSSIKSWRETGCLDDFLLSHSVIEALVIKEILESGFYPTDWKQRTTSEINNEYLALRQRKNK